MTFFLSVCSLIQGENYNGMGRKLHSWVMSLFSWSRMVHSSFHTEWQVSESFRVSRLQYTGHSYGYSISINLHVR